MNGDELFLEYFKAKEAMAGVSASLAGTSSTYGRTITIPLMTFTDTHMQAASEALAASLATSGRIPGPYDTVHVLGYPTATVKDVWDWEKKQKEKQEAETVREDETFMEVFRDGTKNEYIIRVRCKNQFLYEKILTGTEFLENGKQIITYLADVFVAKRIEEAKMGLDEDDYDGELG